MQGIILGSFIQGIPINGRSFAGSAFEWLNAFSITTGVALVFGYALLGSTWAILKTEDETQEWARKTAVYVLIYVIIFMAVVSVWVPFLNDQIFNRWFSLPNFLYLSPIPLMTLGVSMSLVRSINDKNELAPFLLAIMLFILGYFGLTMSLWPWVVPYSISIWDAAAAPESLSLLLVGALILLPVVFAYTAYSYYVFRGKTSHEALY
jgi:cytochrome d ubiquinol oxidase subunit II